MIENGPIYLNISTSATVKVSTITIGAGATGYSDAFGLIDLNDFSLEYKVAGTGIVSVKLRLQERQDTNRDWCIPDNMADIRPNVVDKNQHICRLAPLPGRYIRIEAIEQTKSVTDTVVTIRVIAQRKYPA